MAPVRRYLRITKHSVLEVRIYADRPQDVDSWLLRRGDPALPRIIQAIKPMVLPKLREENERSKSKKKADKKGLKDSVVQDDFEVSIFLTQSSVRHSLLTKSKTFAEREEPKRNGGKLTGWLNGGAADEPVVVRDEDGDGEIDLSKLPDAPQEATAGRKKRKRSAAEPIDVDDVDDTEEQSEVAEAEEGTDTKKKLGFNTNYDGYAIYGRILCLVVKRRGVKTQAATSQQMLESWVSTQAAQDAGIDDERDDG